MSEKYVNLSSKNGKFESRISLFKLNLYFSYSEFYLFKFFQIIFFLNNIEIEIIFRLIYMKGNVSFIHNKNDRSSTAKDIAK